MGWNPFRREARASLESPTVSLTDAAAWASVFGSWNSASGVTVTKEVALGVPAFWAAVNFLAGTVAALPLHEFKRTDKGAERVTRGTLAGILASTVNDDFLTSFRWRKQAMVSALTTGAGRTYVEKDVAGRVVNLWPLDTAKTTVVRKSGRTFYEYRPEGSAPVVYAASEVVDIQVLSLDGTSAVDPVRLLADTIGLAVAMERYAAKFFQNGGVPPLALSGPPASPAAMKRAQTDVNSAIRDAHRDREDVIYLPSGHELKPLGFDPAKGQLVEAQRFAIEQISRVFGLPPVFLQDLTHGTFSNTEQQDLNFVKHTLTQWVENWEQELNAKLYGPRASSRYVEFNLDGLLRGDFKTRMDGYASAIQNGIRTPDEVRALENLPAMGGKAEGLFIQGATVPLDSAQPPAAASPPADPNPAPVPAPEPPQ